MFGIGGAFGIGAISAYYTARNRVNRLNAKIAEYNEGIEKAKQAIELFETTKAKMLATKDEIEPVFQGASGAEFVKKMRQSAKKMQERINQLNDVIDYLTKQIDRLNDQKKLSEQFVRQVDDLIASVRNMFNK